MLLAILGSKMQLSEVWEKSVRPPTSFVWLSLHQFLGLSVLQGLVCQMNCLQKYENVMNGGQSECAM